MLSTLNRATKRTRFAEEPRLESSARKYVANFDPHLFSLLSGHISDAGIRTEQEAYPHRILSTKELSHYVAGSQKGPFMVSIIMFGPKEISKLQTKAVSCAAGLRYVYFQRLRDRQTGHIGLKMSWEQIPQQDVGRTKTVEVSRCIDTNDTLYFPWPEDGFSVAVCCLLNCVGELEWGFTTHLSGDPVSDSTTARQAASRLRVRALTPYIGSDKWRECRDQKQGNSASDEVQGDDGNRRKLKRMGQSTLVGARGRKSRREQVVGAEGTKRRKSRPRRASRRRVSRRNDGDKLADQPMNDPVHSLSRSVSFSSTSSASATSASADTEETEWTPTPRPVLNCCNSRRFTFAEPMRSLATGMESVYH